MEYKVVTAGDPQDLKEKVQAAIAEGWEPCGGVAVAGWHEQWENSRKGHTESKTETMFCQAVVRRPEHATAVAAPLERQVRLHMDEMRTTAPDTVALALDDIADLFEHWRRNRERGHPPRAIRAALLASFVDVLRDDGARCTRDLEAAGEPYPMNHCAMCGSGRCVKPNGPVEPAPSAPAAQAFGIIDPDYARVFTQARIIAWQYGYACLAHGSFTRDLDLLLVPWADRHVPEAGGVVNRIADVCGLEVQGPPSDKPHGRKAWSLLLPGLSEVRWVDVSVLTPA